MADKACHPSDRDLLLLADDELSPRRLARVQSHVDTCPACQARTTAMTRDLADAADALRDSAMPIPAAAPARVRLVAELARLRDHGTALQQFGFSQRAIAAMTTAVAVLGVTWLLAADAAGPRSPDVEVTLRVFLLPNEELTPGLAKPVTVAEVCGQERFGRTQPIAATVHEAVFAQYGTDVRRASDYELDYLITPELGGVPDPRNLWPQAFTGAVWNAYVKDELELHLHELVCDGAIDLETAQREIARDWIAAYKRRFNTDKPRRDYAVSPLTEQDTEFLRAELEELGVAAPAEPADGRTLFAMLQIARDQSVMPSDLRP